MPIRSTDAIRTFPVTGGANGAVAQYLIVAVDTSNPGNVKVSTASLKGFVGITEEPTDTNGYAAIKMSGMAKVKVGTGGVTVGDYVESDASGQIVTRAAAASGSAVKQIIGVAMETATAGNLASVLIQPQLTLA